MGLDLFGPCPLVLGPKTRSDDASDLAARTNRRRWRPRPRSRAVIMRRVRGEGRDPRPKGGDGLQRKTADES